MADAWGTLAVVTLAAAWGTPAVATLAAVMLCTPAVVLAGARALSSPDVDVLLAFTVLPSAASVEAAEVGPAISLMTLEPGTAPQRF
ncbi:UNVERIFIED_CONTAM: hypothetical protein FKN15_077124 [Acipenser sinensis]